MNFEEDKSLSAILVKGYCDSILSTMAWTVGDRYGTRRWVHSVEPTSIQRVWTALLTRMLTTSRSSYGRVTIRVATRYCRL